MELREFIKSCLEKLDLWKQAISNPEHFLSKGLNPTEDQLLDGLEFYLYMVIISMIMAAPMTLGQRGDFAGQVRLAANGLIGLVISALLATAWHFSFTFLGGTADFAGSYLAYVYAFGPYLPICALFSLFMMAMMPAELRRHAGNPAAFQRAMQESAGQPGAGNGVVGCSGCLMFLLFGWIGIVQLKSFGFVHDIGGGKLVGAIVVSGFAAIPVCLIGLPMVSLLQSKE